MKFLDQGFQKLEHEQDRHTDRRDRTLYHAALAGGIYI